MPPHASLVVAAAAMLAACGGHSSPSGPSTPAIPQVAGTYSGPTLDTTITPNVEIPTWALQWLRAGSLNRVFRVCAGTVVIQQTGATLSGSFTQDDTCGDRTGQLSGSVKVDGSVTFSLTGSSDPLSWIGFSQCTAAVGGTTTFTGTVRSGMLDASLPQDAFVNCPSEGNLTVNVHIRGSR